MAVKDQYVKEIGTELGYGAIWFPGVPLTLGTIVEREDGVYVPKSHLDHLNIKFTPLPDNSEGETITHESKGSVEWSVKAAGEAKTNLPNIPKAEAGFGLSFLREGAIALTLTGTREPRIEDQLALERDLADQARAGKWDRDWIVITHLVEAETASIIVSQSKDSSAEFSLGVDGAVGTVKLLALNAGAKLRHKKALETEIVGQAGLTPLFRGYRLKRGFFSGRYDLKPAWSAAATAPAKGDDESWLEPVDFSAE